jgi:hypothetical protein
MERLINRRQQGDLGELSAMEWLASKGAAVLIPFGHSPDYDLVADVDGALLRIQVKTSTYDRATPSGKARHVVALRTSGGNQSWNRVVKKLDPSKFDYLFALTGEGRRWFIPAAALGTVTAIQLGGTKYAEYEVERGRRIREIVFVDEPQLELGPELGGVPKRSNGRRCKRRGLVPSQVRILPPPLASPTPIKPTNYERKLGQQGHAVINQKRRLTIPQRAFFEAGLQNGSKVRVRSLGRGRIVIEQVELPDWARPESGEVESEASG